MAIRKISRLQHRRGLKSDLPPKLREGELGFCLDTRELFIGNSEADQGNSQILTQWTPVDRVVNHAYAGSTGIPAQSVPRIIGAKLDDFVSVKDYGAIGNGIIDDYAAIQLAISDRYGKGVAVNASPLSGYVTIFLPAGTYKISQPLALYPYVRLQGEGMHRTKIVLDNATSMCVVQTADNAGSTTIEIGLNGAVLPTKIDLYDLWLDQPNAEGDVVWINRANGISLYNVKLTGPRLYGSNTPTTTRGIVAQNLGNVIIPKDITVQSCDISGLGHAFYVDDPVTNIKIAMSEIHDCYKGISLGASAVQGGPSFIKVTNNSFNSIDNYGLACFGSNPGVISVGNSFYNVGVVSSTAAIIFGPASTECASIGDQIVPAGNVVINDQNPGYNVVVSPGASESVPSLLGPLTLFNNYPLIPQEVGLAYDPTLYNTINIDYSISRGTNKRVGRLTILTNGTSNTTVLQDEFTSLGNDLGVTFGFTFDVNNHLSITYLTTNTGSDASMKYTESKWFT